MRISKPRSFTRPIMMSAKVSLAGVGRFRSRLAAAVAVVVAVSLLPSAPVQAAASTNGRPKVVQADRVVKGHKLGVKARKADPATRGGKTPVKVSWPKAGTAQVAVPAPGTASTKLKGRSVSPQGLPGRQAGSLPVSVIAPGQLGAAAKGTAAPAASAGKVQVQVLDRAAAKRAGIQGLVFTIGRTDTTSDAGPGRVGVRLDYSGFAGAFGGGYGSRLRLVQLPACVLTTPQLPQCQKATPVATVNDSEHQLLAADIDAAPMVATAPVQTPVVTPSATPSTTVSKTPGASATPTVTPKAVTPKAVTPKTATPKTGVRGRAVSGALSRTAATDATVLAATATASSANGDYTASPLAPSATWNAGGNTGDFTWSYPLRVPPVPGGLSPKLAISYDSSSVDGRTANTGNQPSWVGEGFDLSPGFIQRSYKSCKDDDAGKDAFGNYPGDQCWGYDNATITWNGKGGQLVPDGTGKWHLKDDDGTRVEKLTGTTNGDNDGEYWKVTTPDGVQYFFGLNRLPGWISGKAETGSAWTAPVFGDDSGEPCYKSTGFADSWCQQAYRWNLDYVVDPHGNAISYSYQQEINYYGRNLKATDETTYIRGGYLDHIDYGLRSNNLWPTHAPATVRFATSERCISDTASDCVESNISAHPELWNDVPWDLHCDSGQDCKDPHGTLSPTFWSRKRLTKITTRVVKADGSDWRDVDSWALTHGWGLADSERDLLLQSIQHTGLAGVDTGATAVTLPPVTFNHVQLANRVDVIGDDISSFIRYRLQAVFDETGGALDVSYSGQDCTPGSTPIPVSNTTRCYPVIIQDPGADPKVETPITDWFNKYVVLQVRQVDRTGYSPDMLTKYDYQGGAAWHYADDDGLTKEKYKTWSQFRGYGHVVVQSGGDAGMLTQSESFYMRGMDGDRTDSSGGTRSVSVSDLEGGSYPDHDSLAGFQVRTASYDQPGGTIIAKTVSSPWHSQTATQTHPWGTITSNLTGSKTTRGLTKLSDGTWRETKTTNNTFDPLTGTPTETDDFGDTDTSKNGDERCTTTTLVNNTTDWLIGYPTQVRTVGATCANKGSVDYPTKLISDARTYYDGAAFGTAPTRGEVSQVDKVSLATTSSTVKYVPATKTTYDSYGRSLTVAVADNTSGSEVDSTTTTTYTDTPTGLGLGLTTGVSVATPPVAISGTATSLTTSQVLDPAFGQPTSKTDAGAKVATLTYDALGRNSKVWVPGRSITVTPNLEFTYQIASGSVVAVGTKTLHNDSTQATGYTLYDGMLRPRQTQAPGPAGGRLITETFYNTLGKAAKTYDAYYSSGAPSTTLFGVDTPGAVETSHVLDYDGLARPIADHLWAGNGSGATEKWKTTTSYTGESTTVTPPAGGTPTTTIINARGQTIESRQYTGTGPANYLFTATTYTPTGQIFTVTGPGKAGTVPTNTWTYGYDVRGRKTSETDPDTGSTASTYDDLDRLIQTQDARGKKIATSFDALGRKTALTDVTSGAPGTKLADWTYDTVRKGQLSGSNRYAGGLTYSVGYSFFDNVNRPTRETITIPTATGQDKLASSYTFGTTYNLDNTIAGISQPAGGGLAAESLATTYDADQLGRPIKLTGGTTNSYVTASTYSYTGKPQQYELTTGAKKTWITNTYTYGTQRLATSRTERENITGVDRAATYTYTDAGNITSINDTSRAGVDNQCFTYDPLGRLTEAWAQGTATCAANAAAATIGGPAGYKQTFAYDDTGNRTAETYTDSATTYSRAYTPPTTGHQITAVTQTGSNPHTESYVYDASGNTTKRVVGATVQIPTWDDDGTLAKISDSAKGDTSFVYDASGNRLLRKDSTGVTLYLPGMELRQATGATIATGTRYYTYNGQTIAQRTSDGTTSTVQFLSADHQGTEQLQIDAAYTGTDTTQGITTRRTTPFGQPRGTQPTLWLGDKGFVGGTTDSTGLTHLGAREYDPANGRFISVDPVFDGSDPQSWNGYAYADNTPVTASDPSGLDRCMNEDGTGANCGETSPGHTQHGVGSVGNIGSGGGQGRPHNTVTVPRPKYPFYIPKDAPPKIRYTYIETRITGMDAKDEAKAIPAFCYDYPSDAICGPGNLHALLDLAGMIPGPVGAAAKGVSVGWYAADGKWFDAGMELGLGFILPRALGRFGNGCSSFVPGTKVLLADGTYKPIEKVKVGDKVFATDPRTGKTSSEKVLASFSGTSYDHLVQITIDTDGKRGHETGVIIATEHHLFWDQTHHTWTRADQLTSALQLRGADGTSQGVISVLAYPGHPTVRDLSIDGFHTFYVLMSATSVLVHNSSCPTALGNGTFLHPDGSIRDARGHFVGSTGARVGASAEVNVWDHLETEGHTVVRGAVAVRGNGGQLRYYDGAIDLGGGNYLGIEVKSGGASRTAEQSSFDNWVGRGNVASGVGQSHGFNIVGVFDAITP